ncbi:MAG TPA: hypothetical protein VGD54_06305, partial [Steroidobacteraceae bacterium]
LDEFIAKHAQGYAYGIADVYAWRGENDKAFEWLEREYQRRGTNLYLMRNDIALVSLRGDARFAAMLRKMNLPE